MPPAGWVLLDRCVDYCFDDDEDDDDDQPPSSSSAAAAAAVKSMWGATEASSMPPIHYATVAMLGSIKADAGVDTLPEPPEIATFKLRIPNSHRRGSLSSTPFVACADKGLLVLYAGRYFGPGSSRCGCYLIHDAGAADDVLSTVPPPPDTRELTNGIGSGAVVLRLHHPRPGGPSSTAVYLLAELATMPKREFPDPDAALLLWRSDEHEQPTPQWARKEVHLPREVRWAPDNDDKHMFQGDTSFSGPGGCLCWVDLLLGIVVCTNPLHDAPELRFVPLPDGCPAVSTSDYPYRPRAEEYRCASCVGGRIKVAAMVGLLEDWTSSQFTLTTWTLSSSPDLDGGGWQEDGVFRFEDLWATPEYRALGLPPQTPLCPVLSAAAAAARDEDEDEEGVVVYAVVNDIDERVVVQGKGLGQVVMGIELEFKRQFVLGIDVRHNRIVSTSSGAPPGSLKQMTPRILPF